MGSCLGKPAVARGNQASTLRRLGSRRHGAAAATWQATGVVALRDANLQCLPRGVAELGPKLRTLDATNNKLSQMREPHIATELTPGLANFTSLQRLVLAHNRLVRIDTEVGSLTALRVLVLDENYLTALPDEVGQLVRLEMLSVAANQLEHLPNSIGNLSKLTILNVKSNKLTSFPSSIGDCALLEELVADDNQLRNLPPTLGRLVHLKTLLLNNNKLQQALHLLLTTSSTASFLPQLLLKECVALQTLGLHGNPFGAGDLQQMDSYAEFEGRRRTKVDKQIAGNVMMGHGSLDEGVDRQLINKAVQQERGHLT
eukprot:SM000265S09774  [mRNA]  locus=s265:161388:163894:+ [translate_table: standard]